MMKTWRFIRPSIASNQDESGTSGFRFSILTNGSLQARIEDQSRNSTSTGIVATGSYYKLAVTANTSSDSGMVALYGNAVRMYRQSDDLSIAFEQVPCSNTTVAGKVIAMNGSIWMERNNSSSTRPQVQKESDALKIFNRPMTEAEIEAEFDLI